MWGSPRPIGPTSANDQVGRARRERKQQRDVELGRDDRAGEDDPRLRQRGHRRIERAWVQRAGEQLRVGDVRGVDHVPRERPHPLGQRGRARQHEVGAGGEALLGRAEAVGVDARLRGDVIDAVVDDQRRLKRLDQHLCLRHVRPQDRRVQAEPARGAPHERRQQAGVERARQPAAMERQHERREDVQPVHDSRGREAAPQPPGDARQVAPRELRLAQAERLDEQHPVLARQARTSGGAGWSTARCPSRRIRRTRCRGRAGVGESGIGAMIPGAGACSLAFLPAGGQTGGAAPAEGVGGAAGSSILDQLRERFARVAVVHDWLTIPGGSEQVVLELLEMFPQAELFTSIYDPAPWPAQITERAVHSSFLNRIPGAARHYPKLLPLMNRAFRSFDLSGFDLVLSSSHACAKNVRTPPGALHVCYCHTPMRYAWEEGFLDGRAGLGALARLALPPLLALAAQAGPRGRARPRRVRGQLPPRGGAHRSATTGAPPRSCTRRWTSSTSSSCERAATTTTSSSGGWSRTSASTSPSRRARASAGA